MLSLTVALAISAPLQAPSPGKTGAQPADYESYVLALEWQPTWSVDACPSGKQADAGLIRAMNGDVGAYARTRLSLHGLWPNYDPVKHGGYDWPQYCNVSGAHFPNCLKDPSGEGCAPSEAALNAFNVSGRWQTWALQYAFGTLAAHEWAKHGSCTPWSSVGASQLEYWTLQEAAYTNLSRGKGASLVHANVGGNVSYSELQAAFDADVGGHHATIACVGGCHLDQVWLGIGAAQGTLTPQIMPIHGVNTSGASSCAVCATVHVPNWAGCPPPPPPATSCVPGTHGPPCGADSDCVGVPDCVRCAHSGFCTDLPP